MPKKRYLLDEEGKFLEKVIIPHDAEASAKAHRGIYTVPEGRLTRATPPREKEGYDRYLIKGVWEYREKPVTPEETEGETDGE